MNNENELFTISQWVVNDLGNGFAILILFWFIYRKSAYIFCTKNKGLAGPLQSISQMKHHFELFLLFKRYISYI